MFNPNWKEFSPSIVYAVVGIGKKSFYASSQPGCFGNMCTVGNLFIERIIMVGNNSIRTLIKLSSGNLIASVFYWLNDNDAISYIRPFSLGMYKLCHRMPRL